MNEWSPGGNYSCPGTPNHMRRSFRSQRDDSEKGMKLHVVNARGVSENKHRSYTQHSMEEISKVLLSGVNKKEGGSSTADPRFKRVIPSGMQNNTKAGGESKTQKASLAPDDSETSTSRFPIWNNTEFKSNKSWVDCLKDSEASKFKQREGPKQSPRSPEYFVSSVPATSTSIPGAKQTPEDSNFDQTHEHLRVIDKLSSIHNMSMKSVSKESLSEWTGNTSIACEDRAEDFSNSLGGIPSSTREKQVQNWICEQRPKLERKHSVITVIGQMQDPDSLSSALQEIGKRRKLVKELDRYAVCKKLIESDKEQEINEMMAKIKSLNNGEGVLYSGSNETLNTSTQSLKFCEDKSSKNVNPSIGEKTVSHCNDASKMYTPLGNKDSTKKKFKKHKSSFEYPVKGKTRMLFSSFPYQKMFYILIVICGVLCWFAFFPMENGPYVSFDLFNSRPKPITWYERICNWLWEFFRPSGVRFLLRQLLKAPSWVKGTKIKPCILELSQDDRVAFVLNAVEISQED